MKIDTIFGSSKQRKPVTNAERKYTVSDRHRKFTEEKSDNWQAYKILKCKSMSYEPVVGNEDITFHNRPLLLMCPQPRVVSPQHLSHLTAHTVSSVYTQHNSSLIFSNFHADISLIQILGLVWNPSPPKRKPIRHAKFNYLKRHLTGRRIQNSWGQQTTDARDIVTKYLL